VKQKNFLVIAVIAVSIFLISSAIWAAPGANIVYSETNLGSGLWQYDYTFSNVTTGDEAFELFMLVLYFDRQAKVTGLPLPDGWYDTRSGRNEWEGERLTTFMKTYTEDPIYDIEPGNSLEGFSYIVDYQTGSLPYRAFFRDLQSEIPSYRHIEGFTVTPEPISFILFLSGGATLAVRKYVKRRQNK